MSGRPIIQGTRKTSFSVDEIQSLVISVAICRPSRFQRKSLINERFAARAHCQEPVTNMSLTGSYCRQCPTATEDASGRRGNYYSRREGGHSRLVGDWTVPDQFRFTFRVELRMTVIDRHQGHGCFERFSTDSGSLGFLWPLWSWYTAANRNAA